MKLFLNLLAANTGGQITRAEAFLKRVHKYSPETQVIVLKQSQNILELKSSSYLKVINIDFIGSQLQSLQRLVWENTTLFSVLRDHDVDIYLSFSHYLPMKKLHVPTLIAVSNLAPFCEQTIKLEKIWGRIRLRLLRLTIISSALKANGVIALSKKCETVLLDHCVAAQRLKVIPNGVDPAEKSLEPCQLNGDDCGDYILAVSHFYRYKNFEQLIRAYATLAEELRQRYRLKLVGIFYDQEYVDSLKSISRVLGVESYIDFIPGMNKKSLQKTYSQATLFVFTSLIENCPNILLEAMSFGVPTLSIDNEPMPEFGGQAVGYFPPNNVEYLSQSITTLLNDPIMLSKMAALAEKESKRFSWDTFTDEVMKYCYRINNTVNTSKGP